MSDFELQAVRLRSMVTTNGYDEWLQRMVTTNGYDEWLRRMVTTNGYDQGRYGRGWELGERRGIC